MSVDLRLSVTLFISLEYIVPQMVSVIESVILGRQSARDATPQLRELKRRGRGDRRRALNDECTMTTTASNNGGGVNVDVSTRAFDLPSHPIVKKLRTMNDATCVLAREYMQRVIREWAEYVSALHKAVVEKTTKLNVECTKIKAKYDANDIPIEVYNRSLDELMTELRIFIDERVNLRVLKPSVRRSVEFTKLCDDLSMRYARSYGHVRTDVLVRLKHNLYARIAHMQRAVLDEFMSAVYDITNIRI